MKAFLTLFSLTAVTLLSSAQAFAADTVCTHSGGAGWVTLKFSDADFTESQVTAKVAYEMGYITPNGPYKGEVICPFNSTVDAYQCGVVYTRYEITRDALSGNVSVFMSGNGQSKEMDCEQK